MSLDARGLTLLIPAVPDEERDAVAHAFEESNGAVLRLDRFWTPPPLSSSTTRVYGNDSFCLVLAQLLNLQLTSPPDNLLALVHNQWLSRNVTIRCLGDCEGWSYPLFVKPLVPKTFSARVYETAHELLNECRGLEFSTEVIVSEVATFLAEARAFVLHRNVLDCALYQGSGSVLEAREFVTSLARTVTLPSTLVLDVGLTESGTWALIEANAAWGAGLNGCDAVKVLPAIVAASSPEIFAG